MVRFIKNLLISIRRVVYWLPIIWKDRWWDSSFMLKIMEHKFRYDAARYRKYGQHVGCDKRAHLMLVAAILCKRLHEQEYTTPWDKEATESANQLFEYMSNNKVPIGGLTYCSTEGYEPDPILRKKAQWAWERKDQMQQQDLDYMLTIFNKHLFSWWD